MSATPIHGGAVTNSDPAVTRTGGLLLLRVVLAALRSCNHTMSRHDARRRARGGAFLYSGSSPRSEDGRRDRASGGGGVDWNTP